MTKITQEQANSMMDEIALAIIRTDVDKYMECTKEQSETINENTRTAFMAICEILGIEKIKKS